MSYSDIVSLISGLLQFAVACYALQLSRRFGSQRTGWLLFGTFSLLALAHWLFAMHKVRAFVNTTIATEFTYAIVSLLLLIGLAHLSTFLQGQQAIVSRERRNHAEWASLTDVQVMELTKQNEAYKKALNALQTDLSTQKQAHAQSERTFQELLTAARQTENDLLQSNTALQVKVAEQKATLEQAGDAQRELIATLEKVHTLSVLAAEQAKSRISRIARAAKQVRHDHNLRAPGVPQRKTLPVSLARLARDLSEDETQLLRKIETIRLKLQHFKDATSPQPGSSPVEASNTTNFQDSLIANVTDTGTELVQRETAPAAGESEEHEVRSGETTV